VISHANLVDVVDGRIHADRTIVITEDRIVSIGDASGPAGAEQVDGDGMYIVRGLWDMHEHLPTSGDAGDRSTRPPVIRGTRIPLIAGSPADCSINSPRVASRCCPLRTRRAPCAQRC
jgi:predicted amidohydrolase